MVLIAIANHADHTDGHCFPRLTTLAREASIKERSLYRYIGALIRNGYLRKQERRGDDGRRRATDYWILFERISAPWDWGAIVPDEDDTDPQDVVSPPAKLAGGLDPPTDRSTCHYLAGGPPDIVGRSLDEPSESNPSQEEESEDERFAQPPRTYTPPPIEPMGAVIDQKAKQIFVIEGTRAWKAWLVFKKREKGRSWNLVTSAKIGKVYKRGWYFPSLFPPGQQPQEGLTDEDVNAFANG